VVPVAEAGRSVCCHIRQNSVSAAFVPRCRGDLRWASESGIFQVPRKLEEIGRRSEIVSVLDYDTFPELQFGVPKPDFGAAGLSAVLSSQQFATPRQLRIGIRYEF
jgi:hypothetical protein